jgi:hypothetical protein
MRNSIRDILQKTQVSICKNVQVYAGVLFRLSGKSSVFFLTNDLVIPFTA